MYIFYLDKVALPQTPAEVVLSVKNKNELVDLVGLGEINLAKRPGLSEVEFQFVIPSRRYPWGIYTKGFLAPVYYLTKLETLKTSRKPFQFIITRKTASGTGHSTNLKVTLEDYSLHESVAEGSDIVATVKLKQYKPFFAKKLIVKPAATKAKKPVKKPAPRPAKKPTTTTYKVKRGDSLWSIASRLLGKGIRWKEIYKLNKSIIKNPSLIYPGQKLKIPKK